MLCDYVAALCALGPEAVRRIAFQNEPAAGVLSEDEKQTLYGKAEAVGKEMAARLRRENGETSVEALLTASGGRINESFETPDDDYTLFACFEEPDLITLNVKSVEATTELIETSGLEALLGKVDVRGLLLAHELYHLLESRMGKDSFVRQRHACVFRIGKFSLKTRVGCLEEIAAMAFAKELLNLGFSPYILNVVMVYAFYPGKAIKMAEMYLGKGESL